MSCVESNAPKYLKRPSPPIPANECDIGTIATGNDGNPYQIVAFNSKAGVSHRWVSCDKASTNCGNLRKSVSKPSVHKATVSKKGKVDKTLFSVTGKVKFIRVLKERSIKNPSNDDIYKHLKSKKRYIELARDVAEYQFLYDGIMDQKISPDLTLSFTLQINSDGIYSKERKKSYNFNKDIPSASQVKKELQSSINEFGDGCYGGDVNNECHYPVLQKGPYKGDLLGELTITNLKVSLKNQNTSEKTKVSKKTVSKSNKKSCPPGKVLSPKGRCVIDRSSKKKTNKVANRSVKKSVRKNTNGCVERFEKKYQTRPGPPYPANECPVNTMKYGNDGMMYVTKEFDTSRGRINRWVKL